MRPFASRSALVGILGVASASFAGCDTTTSGQGGASSASSTATGASSTTTNTTVGSTSTSSSTGTTGTTSSSTSSGTGGSPGGGARLFVTYAGPQAVDQESFARGFELAADGGLTEAAWSPASLGTTYGGHGPVGAAICGGFLFIATQAPFGTDEGLEAFSFDAEGAPVLEKTFIQPDMDSLSCTEGDILAATTDGPDPSNTFALRRVLADAGFASLGGGAIDTSFARVETSQGHAFVSMGLQANDVFVYGQDATGMLQTPAKHFQPTFDRARVSPDGQRFAWVGFVAANTYGFGIADVAPDGTLSPLLTGDVDAAHPSPSDVFWVGSRLLASGGGQIVAYDIANGHIVLPAVGSVAFGSMTDVVVDPSGDRFYVSGGGSIAVVDVSASGALSFAPGSPLAVDGNHILLR